VKRFEEGPLNCVLRGNDGFHFRVINEICQKTFGCPNNEVVLIFRNDARTIKTRTPSSCIVACLTYSKDESNLGHYNLNLKNNILVDLHGPFRKIRKLDNQNIFLLFCSQPMKVNFHILIGRGFRAICSSIGFWISLMNNGATILKPFPTVWMKRAAGKALPNKRRLYYPYSIRSLATLCEQGRRGSLSQWRHF